MYCYECMKEIKDGSKFCYYCGKSTQSDVQPNLLKPGTILHNQYLVGNVIGEGGFGITYVGLDLSLDMKIAIKEFYPAGFANRNNTVSNNVTLNYENEGEYFRKGVERFLREAKSIAKFHNEKGIVDVRAFFEENDTAYIIMEYLEGENLSQKLKRDGKFEAEDIFTMFLPMMNTLDKMHQENIIHRDITPDNIRILPDNTLMLMDFGSARYYTGLEKKTMSVQFKPGYAPIEQYNQNGNQGPWTDVYGLCATIYKCVTGVTPDDSLERSQNDTLQKPSELGIHIPESLENIIMYGMALRPENRCQSMSELLKITADAINAKNSSAVKAHAAAAPAAAAVIYNTKAADDEYKTMYADRTYGDSYANNGGKKNAPDDERNVGAYNQNNYKRNDYKKTAYGSRPPVYEESRPLYNDRQPVYNDRPPVYNDRPPVYNDRPPVYNDSQNKKPVGLIVLLSCIGVLIVAISVALIMLKPWQQDGPSDKNTSSDNQSQSLEAVVETGGEDQSETAKGDGKNGDTPEEKVDAATAFTNVTASSTLAPQDGYTYDAANVLKDDETCWTEAAEGYGIGEWIKLDLPARQKIYDLRIVNGYAGTEIQYNGNGKVKKIRIDFSDGQSTEVDIPVFSTSERKNITRIKLEEPIVTESVKITILSAASGSYESDGVYDNCITYIAPN